MRTTLFICLNLIACPLVFWAQPGNDQPCNATTITVGGGCVNGTNVSATETNEGSVPTCVNPIGDIDATVWYRFQATDDSITVNLGDGTMASVAITSVFSGTPNCTTGAGLSCMVASKGGAEADVTGLTIGTWYYIEVDGGKNGGSQVQGTFCISVYETPPPPPPIGTCENPRNLFVGTDCNNIQGLQYDEQNNMLSTNTTTGGDGGASMAGGSYTNATEQTCASTDVGQQGYWVQFTATGTTNTVFNNAGSSGYDYTIFTGSDCAALTARQCFTIAAGGTKTVGSSGGTADDLVIGTEYLVLITPSSTGTATTAFLCITGTAYDPPNDDCANATALSFNTAYTLNNSNAGVDLNNTLCSGSTENNVWVKYTSTYTGTAYVFLQDQDCACGNGMQMSIFNAGASCPNNSSTCSIYINPNNDNDFNGSFSVTNGSTYYIQLDGYAGCGCEFNLCLSTSNSADCSELLPVEMSEINAFFNQNDEVEIHWRTESEKDCDYFDIEKSVDGISYSFVERVKGNGTISTAHNYKATDRSPVTNQVSYYRITQVDFNGDAFPYSPVSVSPRAIDKLVFYPNPSEGKVNIEIPGHAGNIEIWVTSALGRKAFEKSEESNSDLFEIDLSTLESGTYMLFVKTEGNVFTQRIVKK